MDFDSKTAKIIYIFNSLRTENHSFKLEVTNFVDNKTVLEIPFIR